jgi:imidazolonepropionase-like amidohydrolase
MVLPLLCVVIQQRMNCFRYSILLFFLSIVFLQSVKAQSSGRYAIKNVTVIPMDREGTLAGQTVLIDHGKITRIGSVAKTEIRGQYTVIDGTGKFLIPGLFDMHAHFFYEQGNNVNTCEQELKLMLANGLTTVRIEGGHPAYLEAREKVKKKDWIGPQLLVVSLPFAGKGTGESPFEFICTDPAEAVKAVKRFKAEGYDAIKITFMVKPDVYDAIVKTAKDENMKVTGHVGPLVKLPAALAAKQQIEHMDEFIDMLLPDTTYNHGQSVSDMNLWRPKAWETVPHLDESKIPALVKNVSDAGVYVTPTNYFFYSFFGMTINEDEARKREDFQYVPSVLKDYAWKVRTHYQNRLPPEESRMKFVAIRNKMISELWKAGVPLMAGSDSPQWFSVTGFAIHDEIENLVQAGITPFAALQTATINPATYLGLAKQKGTVTTGKQADLLLLDKDPLTDIKNARAIHGIFLNGTWYNKTKIDQLLSDAKSLGN